MTLKRYERTDLIGESHIGQVWKCLDTQTGDDVAALMLNEQIGAVSGWENVWQEVLHYYRDFRHEYIVPARDTDEAQHMVIMELMRGSMRRVLNQKGTIDAALVRTCLRRSLEALSVIHNAGMLHGDIRPDQLLYRHDGAIRLAFSVGLKPGGVVISRNEYNEYFAPELVDIGAGSIGATVDLYALGITAYELLVGSDKLGELGAGVGPNTPEPQGEWLRWQAAPTRTLPPLKKVFSRIPEDLARVVEGLIVKSPSARFDSAAAALKLLATSGQGDDVIVPIAEIPDRPGDHFGDPAVKVNERQSSGWNTGPASGSAPGGTSSEEASKTPFHAGSSVPASGFVVPDPTLTPMPLVSSGATQTPPLSGHDGSYGSSATQNTTAQPGNAAIIAIATVLALIGFAGFQTYRYFYPTEFTEYAVTLNPATAKVLLGTSEELTTKDGLATVRVVKGRDALTLNVTADGYKPRNETLEFTKKEKLKLTLALDPVVTAFTLNVQPVSASVTVETRPKNPNRPTKEPETDGNGAEPANNPSGEAGPLYMLTAADEVPGQFQIAIPFQQEVTLSVSNEGFHETTHRLKGTGHKTARDTVNLVGLTTKYTLSTEPSKAVIRNAETNEPLKMSKGKASYTIDWNEELKLVAELADYEPQVFTLKGTDKAKDSHKFKLERKPTVFEITVTPPDSTVTLDDNPIEVNEGVALVRVKHRTRPNLEISKTFYKPFNEELSWNESLLGDAKTVELELDARPLTIDVTPKGIDWSVSIGRVDGEVAIQSGGETMVPMTAKQIVVISDGYKDAVIPISESIFDQPYPLQLISNTFPDGFTVSGEEVDAETGLPLRAYASKIEGEDRRLQFVLILPGEFDFGVDPDGDALQNGELEIRKENLDAPIYVSTTEVSNAQFAAFVDEEAASATPDNWKKAFDAIGDGGERHPVRHVTFEQAVAFCEWLAKSARLPTEVEWERAARGVDQRTFPWGSGEITAELSNLNGQATETEKTSTQPVTALPNGATPDTQIYHLLGNVAEWCSDVYQAGFNDDETPGIGINHVIRGASFIEIPGPQSRATWRANVGDAGAPDVGFRVVVPVAPLMIGD